MPHNPNAVYDRQLKERCLAGEDAGWVLLYAENLSPLVAFAHWFLADGRLGGYSAEAAAQGTLASLWDNDRRRLQAYEPNRAPWQIYLRVLTRRDLIDEYRREKCRRAHEHFLGTSDRVDPGASDGLLEAKFHEYAARLSPTLKPYFEKEYLGIPSAAELPPCSPTTERKRRERLIREAEKHLGR